MYTTIGNYIFTELKSSTSTCESIINIEIKFTNKQNVEGLIKFWIYLKQKEKVPFIYIVDITKLIDIIIVITKKDFCKKATQLNIFASEGNSP